jgi:hypothetical protein
VNLAAGEPDAVKVACPVRGTGKRKLRDTSNFLVNPGQLDQTVEGSSPSSSASFETKKAFPKFGKAFFGLTPE